MSSKDKRTMHPARMQQAAQRRDALQPMVASLSNALQLAENLLTHEDVDVQLRAVHAVNQCVNTYLKAYEVGELEYRMQDIASRLESMGLDSFDG